MTETQIRKLQKEYGYDKWQNRIDDGSVWKFEGSVGRCANDLITGGVCFLPKEFTADYYGNRIPSRTVLKKGSKGTLENAERFWTGLLDGEYSLNENENEWL